MIKPMSEKAFRQKCCKLWQSQGAFIFPNVAFGTMSTPNWPDLYVSQGKWQGWIEMKGETTSLTKGQELVIRRLNRARKFQAIVYRAPGLVQLDGWSETVPPHSLLDWLNAQSSL